jgi:ubiquinone/menaquinone biosynthesis C-methylase UbiE
MQLEDVQKNYDRASNSYDKWTEIVFGRVLGIERLREHTIDLLGDLDGKVVLDVGCGTGRNFPFLVSRVGASGRVIGVDYSQGMLNVARARIERAGWSNVELRRDDAAKLATITRPVDAVVSVWCLGIVHDLSAALGRVIDLLSPEGRLAIMDFDRSQPDEGLLHWLYPVYSPLLRWAGIDSAEDLDDAELRAKWARGRAVLESRIGPLQEERYLSGGGIILSGSAPSGGA